MFRIVTQRFVLSSAPRFKPAVSAILPSIPSSIASYNTGIRKEHVIPTSDMVRQKISDAIIFDHRELDEYYRKVMDASDHDTATRWQNQFVWELARHSIGEELVVYPAFEKYLKEKGKEMADKDRADHNKLKVELHKFQNLKSTDPDFKPTLQQLFDDLSKHVKEEEEHDLPALENALVREDSEELAASFERTKFFVPTRSHPWAPDKPPFETVAGLLAAPLDRLSDLFRKFPKEPTPRETTGSTDREPSS